MYLIPWVYRYSEFVHPNLSGFLLRNSTVRKKTVFSRSNVEACQTRKLSLGTKHMLGLNLSNAECRQQPTKPARASPLRLRCSPAVRAGVYSLRIEPLILIGAEDVMASPDLYYRRAYVLELAALR